MADIASVIFNNPTISDIVLTVNGEQFHLFSQILEKHTDFFKVPKSDSQLVSSSGKMIVLVSKELFNVDDPLLKSEFVNAVLKFVYGFPLEVTADNATDVFHVSSKFKITNLTKKCTDLLSKDIKSETLMDDYLKVINEVSPLKGIYETKFKLTMDEYDKDKVFQFTAKLSFDDFHSLVALDVDCNETLIYGIVENYCSEISDDQLKEKLFSCIKLNKLPGDVLVTKIKNNPHINKEKYYQTLENIAKNHYIRSIYGNKFAFGKLRSSYKGYRLVTEEEWKSPTFIKLFGDEYRRNDGLLSLDSFKADIIYNDGYAIRLDAGHMRLDNKIVQEKLFYKFNVENSESYLTEKIYELRSHSSKHSYVSCDVGLFVRENIQS